MQWTGAERKPQDRHTTSFRPSSDTPAAFVCSPRSLAGARIPSGRLALATGRFVCALALSQSARPLFALICSLNLPCICLLPFCIYLCLRAPFTGILCHGCLSLPPLAQSCESIRIGAQAAYHAPLCASSGTSFLKQECLLSSTLFTIFRCPKVIGVG